jgi:predicted SAM-dependent methyltransferase
MNKKKKLHVGCGTVLLPGWINADTEGEDLDVKFDITKSWPFETNSISLIYSEHVFEHLKPNEGQIAWKEALRVLKPNGVVRTAMPDLDYLCSKYFEDWKEQDWIKNRGYSHIRTKAEMLNTCFYFWNHKWLYNFEEFVLRIEETGFKNPVRMEYCKSLCPELCNLETREDSKLIVEVEK